MTDERWPRVKAPFQAAVERPADERDAFLAAATGDDAALVVKSGIGSPAKVFDTKYAEPNPPRHFRHGCADGLSWHLGNPAAE